MSAQFMRRNIRISVRLTEEEHRLLKEKMERIGVTNQEAFLRKMALDGLVIKLDLPELKEMLSLLRYTSNNINQIAKRLNESGRAYETDFADIMEKQEQLWGLANEILIKLSALRCMCRGVGKTSSRHPCSVTYLPI